MERKITVSVLIIAYNQIAYIDKALRSAQMQTGAGEIEIIIHDDCSTDGTREFIVDAAARDPRVRLVLSESNSASNTIVRRPLEMARGRYVALLDADDYWTVDNKLARQVRILDTDPTLAGCFHNAWALDATAEGYVGNGDRSRAARLWTSESQPRTIDHSRIWEGNPFATAAGMLRRSALREIDEDWYDQFFLTDWPLYAAAATHGDLAFINEPVAVYQLHAGSTYAARRVQDKMERIAEFYKHTARGLSARVSAFDPSKEAARGAGYFYGGLAERHFSNREFSEALTCLWHSAHTGSVSRSIGWRKWSNLLGKSLAAAKRDMTEPKS
tara:strand:+ start:133016 stop:134002 length:987 start_codon:yes stop_codon:yes gene_type:complete